MLDERHDIATLASGAMGWGVEEWIGRGAQKRVQERVT